jgi:hypothetical protein
VKPIKLAVRYLLLTLVAVVVTISYVILLLPVALFAAFVSAVFATGNFTWWCGESLLAWSYDKPPPPLKLWDGLK